MSDLNKETKAIDKALSGEIKDLLDDLPGLYTPVLVENAASASSSLGAADLTYSSTQSIVRKRTGLGTSTASGSWYLKNSSEVSLSCSPFPSVFSLTMEANPVWTYLDEQEKKTS